jgi:recombination protein RecR
MNPNGVFTRLIEEFRKLPGIGQKTAQRLAFFILKISPQEAKDIAQAILDVKDRLRLCSLCQNVSETEVCGICQDHRRDQTKILVVKEPSTLYAIERTGEYRGLYHVLLGTLSALDGQSKGQIGMIPTETKAKELLDRLQKEATFKVQEVILATDPTMEGEAMALYLTKLIKPFGVKVTRIAYGIPVGVDLEYADEVTLIKSLEGRREISP